MEALKRVDLAQYLQISRKSNPTAEEQELLRRLCDLVSCSLRETGALLVKDPRCTEQDNDAFIRMMEAFFEKPDHFKLTYHNPDSYYELGVMPPPKVDQPSMRTRPNTEWHFNWMVNNTSHSDAPVYPEAPVIPEGFPDWEKTMNSWGSKLRDAFEAVAEMAAVGFGLPKNEFTRWMGKHELATSASDLRKYGKVGTVLAGSDTDCSFLTIHGRSRFPGFNIWTRDGQKIEAEIPVGCLLVQAGDQMGWITAHYCKAGMNEVLVTERTLQAIESAEEENRSLWRVSSTLFGRIDTWMIGEPLEHFCIKVEEELETDSSEIHDWDMANLQIGSPRQGMMNSDLEMVDGSDEDYEDYRDHQFFSGIYQFGLHDFV